MFKQLIGILKVAIIRQLRLGTKEHLEEAIIVKSLSRRKVIIQRANGEMWMLETKTSYNWFWKYERRKVLLQFGHTSSKLINNAGDVCEFWTRDRTV